MLRLLGRSQALVAEFPGVVKHAWAFPLQEVHHEGLGTQFVLVHLLLSHGTLVQLDGGVVAGHPKGQAELVGLEVSSEVDVDLVHDAADLAGYETVVHDGEESLQPHGVAIVDFLGVHLPAVVDDHGVGERGEIHFFAAGALEDTLDGPAVDPVGHILFSQLTQHLGLTDLAVVHGHPERREGALQVRHQGERHEGDVPRLLHLGEGHAEGGVGLWL